MIEFGEGGSAAAPVDIDPFGEAYLLDPHPHYAQLREAGPVAYLPRYQCFAAGRHAVVRAILGDPATFCSGAGVGLSNFRKEPPWRPPSMVLETDPPEHTRNRAIISRTLSPKVLRDLRQRFEAQARELVDRLVALGTFDGAKQMGEAFPLKVFADAVGLRADGRENLVAYGNMVFNGMGPRNALYENAMRNAEAVAGWVWEACQRENLSEDGLGTAIYTAVDEGVFTPEQAATLVRSFLSAGIDTTANGIGLAAHCFALHPEQWDRLRAEPSLARQAFEEVLRYCSPFQTFFRTTTRDVRVGGVGIPAGEKVLLSMGAANHDPDVWPEPGRFDIGRSTAGHLAFGGGIHGCVGQMIARLEVEVLLVALAERVERIELAGEPRPMMHNTLRGFEQLPLRLRA
ncbi:cytochrome P450 [Pigmentiphaga soli]|uniref:Cytochrome P450 n=1 Tax=Pigmentiphaga soli TaxID=1007095 RepID=A0ABP8H8V2_9BURK